MSINVTVVGSTGVSASIASSDGVAVSVGGVLANTPLTALQVTAGANITITTTSGVYTISGPNPAVVQSVNGRTGAIVLTAVDITAAAATHTHAMSDITDLAYPVNVVNGQTGTVLLTSADVSAASAVHTHVASEITNLTSVANVVSINGQTGVAALTSADVSAASAVHSHVAADIADLGGYLTSVANVVSVNGITGAPVIVGGSGVTVSTAGSSITIEAAGGGGGGGAALSDATPQSLGAAAAGTSSLASRADHVHQMPTASQIGAAEVSHTHAMSDVTDLVFPVSSVNGKTGTAILSSVDVSAASAAHSHVASDIANITSVANVVSVNGKTGTVNISAADVTAAAATHIHQYVTSLNQQTGAVTVVAGANITVTTAVGSVTVVAPNPGDALPLQGGNANRVLGSNGTSASWVTRYSVVEPVIVAGEALSLTKNTTLGQVTVSGKTAAVVATVQLTASQNNYNPGNGDVIRLSPTSPVTLTGLAGGVNGVVRVLYNVGTSLITLAHDSATSQEANRFAILSGNIVLDQGDSASIWYDGASQRWRVLEDRAAGSVPAGAYNAGGVGISYLFG